MNRELRKSGPRSAWPTSAQDLGHLDGNHEQLSCHGVRCCTVPKDLQHLLSSFQSVYQAARQRSFFHRQTTHCVYLSENVGMACFFNQNQEQIA
jgi:hypothetical protein